MPINVRTPVCERKSTPMQRLKSGEYAGNIAAVLTTAKGDDDRIKFLLQLATPYGACYVTTPPFRLSLDERGFFFNLVRSLANVTTSDELVSWMESSGYVDEQGVFNETCLIGLPVIATVEAKSVPLKGGQKFRAQQVMTLRSAPDTYRLDPQWLIPGAFGLPKYNIDFADELELDEHFVPHDDEPQEDDYIGDVHDGL